MNRWAARIIGIAMLIVFVLVFTHLYRQLVMLQNTQKPAATQGP